MHFPLSECPFPSSYPFACSCWSSMPPPFGTPSTRGGDPGEVSSSGSVPSRFSSSSPSFTTGPSFSAAAGSSSLPCASCSTRTSLSSVSLVSLSSSCPAHPHADPARAAATRSMASSKKHSSPAPNVAVLTPSPIPSPPSSPDVSVAAPISAAPLPVPMFAATAAPHFTSSVPPNVASLAPHQHQPRSQRYRTPHPRTPMGIPTSTRILSIRSCPKVRGSISATGATPPPPRSPS